MAASLRACPRVIQKCLTPATCCRVPKAKYAKGGIGGGKMSAQPMKKPTLEVETDVGKLTKLCCGANIYTTGTDPPLKADSEYPDWLWSLRLDRRPPDLSEMDPDTYQYWRRLRKLTLKQKNKIQKINPLKR